MKFVSKTILFLFVFNILCIIFYYSYTPFSINVNNFNFVNINNQNATKNIVNTNEKSQVIDPQHYAHILVTTIVNLNNQLDNIYQNGWDYARINSILEETLGKMK
jgi:hypothetical protein